MSGSSSKANSDLEPGGTPSCSAGVLPGSQPVASTMAARMAANHSATNRLKVEGSPNQLS